MLNIPSYSVDLDAEQIATYNDLAVSEPASNSLCGASSCTRPERGLEQTDEPVFCDTCRAALHPECVTILPPPYMSPAAMLSAFHYNNSGLCACSVRCSLARTDFGLTPAGVITADASNARWDTVLQSLEHHRLIKKLTVPPHPFLHHRI